MHTLSSFSKLKYLHVSKFGMINIPKRMFWGQPPPPPDFDPQKDYYKILGVSKTSTQAEIKKK